MKKEHALQLEMLLLSVCCLSDSALSIFESQSLVAAVIEEAQLNAQNFTFSSMIFHLLSHTTLPAKILHQERSGILWKKMFNCTVVK